MQINAFTLRDRQRRLMKMLSMQRVFPSIEMRVPALFSQSMPTKDVNCDP